MMLGCLFLVWVLVSPAIYREDCEFYTNKYISVASFMHSVAIEQDLDF